MRAPFAILCVAACASAPVPAIRAPAPTATSASTSTPTSTPAAPPAAVASARPAPPPCDDHAPRRFTLAHVNDMQARYGERIAGHSRYAYVAGFLRSLPAQSPALALDAGDDYEKGSVADFRSMGEATRQVVHAMPFAARTIGNHDFAYGEAAVLRDVLTSPHPVLAANVHRGQGPGPFAPYARFDVGCVRVGVVGVTTYNFGADDQPTREPYDGVFNYDDHLWQSLDEQVRAHRAEVDVMIALTHVGLATDGDLARAVGGIDVIVGGHSEDLVKEPQVLYAHGAQATWILQAGHYAQNVGVAEIAVGADRKPSIEKYRIVPVGEAMPVAQDVDDLVARVELQFAPDAQKPIARVDQDIRGGRAMAEMAWRAVREQWDVAGLLVAKDAFWDGLPAGPVTLQRLYDSMPVQRQPAGTPGFTSLWIVELTGEKVKSWRDRVVTSPSPMATGIAPPEYVMFARDDLDPRKTYRVAVEKRAIAFPNLALVGAHVPQGRFAGEIIDVVEAYARARSAKGQGL